MIWHLSVRERTSNENHMNTFENKQRFGKQTQVQRLSSKTVMILQKIFSFTLTITLRIFSSAQLVNGEESNYDNFKCLF